MERLKLDVKGKTIGPGPKTSSQRILQAKHNRRESRSNAYGRGRKINESTDVGLGLGLDILDEDNDTNLNAQAAVLPTVTTSNITAGTTSIKDSRRIMLGKWKSQKEMEKKLRKEKEKPVFRTGVVHHPIAVAGLNPKSAAKQSGSELKKSRLTLKKRIKPPSPLKMVVPQVVGTRQGATTRIMAKKSTSAQLKAIPKSSVFKAPKGIKPVVLTMPHTPKLGIAPRKMAVKATSSKTGPSAQLLFSPIASLPTSSVRPISFQAATPKYNCTVETIHENDHDVFYVDDPSTSLQTTHNFSPYVTVRRGKYSDWKKADSTSNAPSIEKELDTKQEQPKKCKSPSLSAFIPNALSPSSVISSGTKREQNRSKIPSLSAFTPNASSPSAVMRSGTKQEHGRKSKLPSLSRVPDMTAVLQRDTESKKDALYFRNLLEAEIARLSAISEEWEGIRSGLSNKVSEDVASEIDLATGQTRLLIRSKFKQFRGLTYDCEIGTCLPPVLLEDLQGFWDMIYMQVEGLDANYLKLTQLKSNNWEEKPIPVHQKKKAAPKLAPKRTAPDNTARSGMRAMIEAARKRKLEEDKLEAKFNARSESLLPDPRIAEIIGTTGNSGKRKSLLQQVLSTGAAKRVAHNSPILMRVSQNAKTIGSPNAGQCNTDNTPLDTLNGGFTPFKSTNQTTGSSTATQYDTKNTPHNVTKAGSTPFKSILKDVSINDSAKSMARKTVNFRRSLEITQLSESDGSVTIVSETNNMLPPSSVTLVASTTTRRGGNQSLFKQLNIRGRLRQSDAFIATKKMVALEKDNSAVLVTTDTPSKENKRQSLSASVNTENTPNKARKSYKKTPHKASQQVLNAVTPSKANKRQSVPAFVDIESSPNKQRRSFRKTPLKDPQQVLVTTDTPLAKEIKRQSLSTLVNTENTPNKHRKSYRKTPHKATQQADRISLFGGLEMTSAKIAEHNSPTIFTLTETGDLMSFDTPVRRSTRLSRKSVL